ncbi:MAG: hypothetical protein LBQ09_12845 [Acidobacteriaceae bacterium]|jgi:hypothetical protein|nr:hypothetical protein [Acidobacteriaceae bacterium]
MRLGFDLDGTVADMHSALAREVRLLFPGIDPASVPWSASPESAEEQTAATSDDTPRVSIGSLSSRQQRAMWKAVGERTNFWETLDEIEPGALAQLYQLVQERRWELIFLTSRPETKGDTAQAQSYRWLKSKGYDTPSVFVVHGSRGKIASALALDVLVDDRPENCLDVAVDSIARPILVWRGDRDSMPGSTRQLGIGTVGSIAEVLDILKSLSRQDAEPSSLVDRLKERLGLKRKRPS